LVEPVQSRHPYNQPIEFLKEIRKLTIETDIPLIFDEMITGFRVCPKGAQGYFNIKADIATYGKIPGGGLPTGMIAGSAKYMDIIDGGKWNFGDNSMPKSKRTLMAGTHSQNPLKIAATYATLKEIKKRSSGELNCDNCSCFQKALNSKTESMANELNVFFDDKHLPISVDYFGSLFRFRFVDSYWGVTEALFFILLRMNGVETNIQGNCFLTSSHTDKDVALIIDAVKESIVTLLDNNYFSFENNEEFDSEEYIADEEDQNNEFGDSKSNGHVNDEQLERLKKLIIADIKNC
jgi:microcystin synthetase protein McyE